MIESGSAKKPMSTLSAPAGSHVYRVWMLTLALLGRSSMAKNMTSDHTNARAMNPVAIQPAIGSPMRLPNSSSRTAPHSGRAGTIHTRSRRSRALTSWLRPS